MNDQQLQEARRVADLITGFLNNHLTLAQRRELDEWIAASDENLRLFEKLTDENNIEDRNVWIKQLSEKPIPAFTKNKKSIVLMPAKWWAAAAILLIAGLFIYKSAIRPDANNEAIIALHRDTAMPGVKKALLTIGNGETIQLADQKNMLFADNTEANNSENVLAYRKDARTAALHTLATPAGGEYRLVLSDGTKVWLNAQSSIRYPTSFTENTRNVSVSGEVYFEVTPSASRPFIVDIDQHERVQVLGTRFNVHAYSNEGSPVTTLLEGSVRIGRKVLRPGESHQDGRVRKGNAEQSIAWTRGLFHFERNSLQEVMVQLERWYNIEVIYTYKPKTTFTGKILRNSSLQDVLRMLQLSGGVHFDIRGKQVTVRS